MNENMNDLVMGEIPHQPSLNVGVAGNVAKDLGTLEGCLCVGASVVEITARRRGGGHHYRSSHIYSSNRITSHKLHQRG